MESTIKRLTSNKVPAVLPTVDGRQRRARTSQKLGRNKQRRHLLKRNSSKGRHVDSYC